MNLRQNTESTMMDQLHKTGSSSHHTKILVVSSSKAQKSVEQQEEGRKKKKAIFFFLLFYFVVFGIQRYFMNDPEESSVEMSCWNSNLQCNGTIQYAMISQRSFIYMETLFKIGEMKESYSESSSTFYDCSSYQTNSQIHKTIGIAGQTLDPNAKAFPCGLIQSQYPDATLQITDNHNTTIQIIQNDNTFFETSFHYPRSLTWVDQNDPSYQSWVEENAYLGTRKLIGMLDANLSPSRNYTFTFTFHSNIPTAFSNGFYLAITSGKEKNFNFCIIHFIYAIFSALFVVVMSALTFLDYKIQQEGVQQPGKQNSENKQIDSQNSDAFVILKRKDTQQNQNQLNQREKNLAKIQKLRAQAINKIFGIELDELKESQSSLGESEEDIENGESDRQ